MPEAHDIPLKVSRTTSYSKIRTSGTSPTRDWIWDPENEPQYETPGFLEMCDSPMDASDEPTYVEIEFEQGVPVALDWRKNECQGQHLQAQRNRRRKRRRAFRHRGKPPRRH